MLDGSQYFPQHRDALLNLIWREGKIPAESRVALLSWEKWCSLSNENIP